MTLVDAGTSSARNSSASVVRDPRKPTAQTVFIDSSLLASTFFADAFTSTTSLFAVLGGLSVCVRGDATSPGGFVTPAPDPAESPTARSIRELRDLSGLTWDEVAQLFGVSRRAVHRWAAGGRMNARHASLLSKVSRMVRRHDLGEPSLTRSSLLSPQGREPSAFQSMVRIARYPTSRMPRQGVDEVLGARHDTTDHTGAFVGVEIVDEPEVD